MKLTKSTLPLWLGVICAVTFLTACERSASTPPVPTGTPQNALTTNPTFRPLAITLVPPGAAGAKAPDATAVPGGEVTATAIAPTPLKTADKNSPYMGQHSVRGGETLYSIGRAYGVSPMAIAELNNIGEPYTIYPGQTLNIPRVRWPGGVPPGPVAKPQFEANF